MLCSRGAIVQGEASLIPVPAGFPRDTPVLAADSPHPWGQRVSPPAPLPPPHTQTFWVVSLQDFFRYHLMKDKTEYRVHEGHPELETRIDLIKKGGACRGSSLDQGRGEY